MWNIDEFLSGLNIDLDRLRDVFTYDPQAPMIFSSGIFLWLFVAFYIGLSVVATPDDGAFAVCHLVFLLLLL